MSAITQTEVFNKADVEYLMLSIGKYYDIYTIKLKAALRRYMRHHSLDVLHEDLYAIGSLCTTPLHQRWEINARMSFLEVIYPVA